MLPVDLFCFLFVFLFGRIVCPIICIRTNTVIINPFDKALS